MTAIEAQIDALTRSAAAAPGAGPSAQASLEDLAAIGAMLFDVVEAHVARVQRSTGANGTEPTTEPDEILRAYRSLDAAFDAIARVLGAGHQAGLVVSSGERFEVARGHLKSFLSIDPARVQSALGHARQGQTKTTAEVRDGPRRRLVAGG